MTALYELESAGVMIGDRPLLVGLTATIPDHAITVVLGPGGAGKSSLLAALAGRLADGLAPVGRWRFRGSAWPAWAGERIALVRQRRRGAAPTSSWREALASGADTVLLDEPCSGPGEKPDLPALIEALAAHRARGGALVVTHDVELARAIGDHACLVCAGRVEGPLPATEFFDAPRSELISRFLAQGNCWPQHPLPSHFHWVRPRLAGMGRPGLLGDVGADLAALAGNGIELLVSLTEDAPPAAELRAHGLTGRHVPVPDMGVPSLSTTASVCREIDRTLDRGAGVAVHCHAGLGRTGAVLAAYLVATGTHPDAAVEEVRAAIRGAIQSRVQLQFVYRFAQTMFGGAP